MTVPATAVLIAAGAQVPVIPSIEAAGSEGAGVFWQIGPIAANVGVISGVTVIEICAGMPH